MVILRILLMLYQLSGSFTSSTYEVQKGKSCTFKCPFVSTSHAVLWFGPENLIIYTRNREINRNIQRQHRIGIVGNTTVGEYNLHIKNLSRIDDGLYRCTSVINGRSVKADFILKILQPDVIVDPMVSCNASNDINLTCSINTNDTYLWQNRWMHYRNNIFIRTYSGSDSLRESVWNIRYCDYQDAGEYVCSWTYNQSEVTATSIVVVYGRPIISFKDMDLNEETWMLSIYFFTSSLPIEVYWFINDQYIHKNNSSIDIANVTLICYEKNISTAGYRSDFLLTNLNERQVKITCIIENQYGTCSVDKSFEGIRSSRKNGIGSTYVNFPTTTGSTVAKHIQPKVIRSMIGTTTSSSTTILHIQLRFVLIGIILVIVLIMFVISALWLYHQRYILKDLKNNTEM